MKRRKRWILTVIAVVVGALVYAGGRPAPLAVLQRSDLDFGPASDGEPFRFTDEHAARVDELVKSVQAQLDVPSFAVGVVQGDGLVYRKAFGFQRLSTRQPASPETLYHIGSVSKPITSTLLMVLVERGDLSLDDPISAYLPPIVCTPTRGGEPSRITIRHLVTHSSGLPMSPPNRRNVPHGIWPNPGQALPYSVADLYEALGSTELLFEPGTDCSYSNYGYGLLGHVMERAAGGRLEVLLSERLFAPLGMQSTTVTLDENQLKKFATHYWQDDRGHPRTDRPRTEFGEVFAYGGVVSCIDDTAKLVSLHFDPAPTVLRDETLQRLRTPAVLTAETPLQLERDGVSMLMALGWRVQWPDKRGGIVNHSGEMDGHSAYVAFAPSESVGVIVLANLGGSQLRRINPTAAIQLGVAIKEMVLYDALGWKPH